MHGRSRERRESPRYSVDTSPAWHVACAPIAHWDAQDVLHRFGGQDWQILVPMMRGWGSRRGGGGEDVRAATSPCIVNAEGERRTAGSVERAAAGCLAFLFGPGVAARPAVCNEHLFGRRGAAALQSRRLLARFSAATLPASDVRSGATARTDHCCCSNRARDAELCLRAHQETITYATVCLGGV